MKIVRFLTDNGQILHGRYRDDEPAWADVIEGEILQDFKVTSKKAKIAQFLPPIWPSNILALGLNYRKHADETKMEIPEFPVLFVKTTNSLIGHEAPILLVEHVMKVVVALADELVVLNFGKEIALGKPEDVMNRKEVIEAYLGDEYA